MASYDFLLKFLVTGDSGTGKSCLLHQFVENKCNVISISTLDNGSKQEWDIQWTKVIATKLAVTDGCVKEGATHTIGVEFGSRIVTIGKNQVKLQIWDTAGQERFRSVTRNYYRGAAGALLVYDISNRASFMNISRWIADARKLAGVDISLMLVGNKRDLEDREVSFSEASRFAQENEMAFLETSALTGDGVEETFLKCGRAILSKIETGQLDPERPGSGIQYGDSNLRRISQKNRPVRQKSQCC